MELLDYQSQIPARQMRSEASMDTATETEVSAVGPIQVDLVRKAAADLTVGTTHHDHAVGVGWNPNPAYIDFLSGTTRHERDRRLDPEDLLDQGNDERGFVDYSAAQIGLARKVVEKEADCAAGRVD
jgi:hypothetical protein